MSVAIDIEQKKGKVCVRVSGEVDVSNADQLRDALGEELKQSPKEVEVDISGVPYIDSTGIGVLVGGAHHAQELNIKFAVSHPQRNVARVLSLLGVADDLGVQGD
ncbi:MAG: STAS domain-containing protein [Atopobiaceae bacterium]|jgi:anti-sigma B factor antagonist|nr:STAS domain-containing protein [Atopobiaceae bacterium]